jgi:hypothetical protein
MKSPQKSSNLLQCGHANEHIRGPEKAQFREQKRAIYEGKSTRDAPSVATTPFGPLRRWDRFGNLDLVNLVPSDSPNASLTPAPAPLTAQKARFFRRNARSFPQNARSFSQNARSFCQGAPSKRHAERSFSVNGYSFRENLDRFRKTCAGFGQTCARFGQTLPRRHGEVTVSRKQVPVLRVCSRFSPKTFPDFTSTNQ